MDDTLIAVDGNLLGFHHNRVFRKAAEGKDIQGILVGQLVCQGGLARNDDGAGTKVVARIAKGFRLAVQFEAAG